MSIQGEPEDILPVAINYFLSITERRRVLGKGIQQKPYLGVNHSLDLESVEQYINLGDSTDLSKLKRLKPILSTLVNY